MIQQVTNNIEDIYPLTSLQHGLLFHSVYKPGAGEYITQMVITIEGSLDKTKLRQAWQLVQNHHPILRTSFHWQNLANPMQCVHKEISLPWREEDWQGDNIEVQQTKLNEFLSKDRDTGFILEKAPLIRCTLIQNQEQEYQLVWSHHHMLLDGWCLPIVLNQVFSCYMSLLQEKTCIISESPPYRNYIAWLKNQNSADAKNYWSTLLRNFSEPAQLTIGSKPVESQVTVDEYLEAPHKEELVIDKLLNSQLKTFAQQQQVTLSTLLQAAWSILLSHYSNSQDIVFGAVISGRPSELSGVEQMVGLFINTVPVRVFLKNNSTIITILKEFSYKTVHNSTCHSLFK